MPPALRCVVSVVTALILVLAANTAFNGFPVLGSILARDGYLPRQLHTRGDRLAFSNGIIGVGWRGHHAHHHLRCQRLQADPALHRRCLRLVHDEPDRHGQALDAASCASSPTRSFAPRCGAPGWSTSSVCCSPGTVLIVVLLTKFTRGAYLAVIAMVGAVRADEGHPTPLHQCRRGAEG